MPSDSGWESDVYQLVALEFWVLTLKNSLITMKILLDKEIKDLFKMETN